MTNKKKVISVRLLVEEGLIGTHNQLLAVVDQLRARVDVEIVTKGRADLVLAAGRKAVWPALWQKLLGRKVVFVQDPRWCHFAFDAVYCPQHDPARGSNVHLTHASPTRVQALPDAPEANTVALLIGGLRKGKGVIALPPLNPAGKTWQVTFSRRTPDSVKEQVRAMLPDATTYDPASGEANPYDDFLKRAETILVTDDSVSMMADACSTGRGVYILPFLRPKGRVQNCAEHLIAIGAARIYTGDLEPYTPDIVLNDADNVAADIAEHLLAR